MLADVLPVLACPHCGAALALDGASVRCQTGHGFDIARQGYVNLSAGGSPAGDSAAMVAARAAFLGAGHYAPITRALVKAATAADVAPDGYVVDLGAGTGHYLAAVLDDTPGRVGLAMDTAKPALRRAARAHPRLGAVGCDLWGRLPIRDGAISVALNVFAPRNPLELRRILAADGMLVVVAPTAGHLAELVSALKLLTVPPDKASRLADALAPGLALSTQDGCEFGLELSHEDIRAMVGMGPSAWHLDAEVLDERVATLPEPVRTTASVLVSTFRPRRA